MYKWTDVRQMVNYNTVFVLSILMGVSRVPIYMNTKFIKNKGHLCINFFRNSICINMGWLMYTLCNNESNNMYRIFLF